jgi:tetratricopeptide (TPR) repeat protein
VIGDTCPSPLLCHVAIATPLVVALAQIAARYFPLQPSRDISFELGRICMGLKRYAEAIRLFAASQRQCGEHQVRTAARASCRDSAPRELPCTLVSWCRFRTLPRRAPQVTHYNIGICAWYLEDVASAHAAFARSVELKPDYAEAQSWKTRCEARMQGERFATASAAASATALQQEQQPLTQPHAAVPAA